MCRSWLLIFLSGTIAVSGGEPPKIDRVSPPGIQRGTTVDVKLPGKPGDGPLRIWSDRSELEFSFSEKQDAATVTAPQNAEPGVHWIRFYNDHGAGGLLPFFVGVVPEVAEVEPNNDSFEAQKLELPALLINGVLDKAGEVDTYSIRVTSGQTLVASMQANNELGSPMDGVLQVLDSGGTVVAHNDDDHAMDPQIAYTAPADGIYFVRTFAFPATPNSTIRLAGGTTYRYRLTITTQAFIDHVAPAVVDCKQENRINVYGWNLGESLQTAKIDAFPDQSVKALAGGYANSIQISAIDGWAGVESGSSAQPVTVPGAVTGCIKLPGEIDTFTVEGKKGDKLTITVFSRSLYSQLDPVVTVTDESGKVLKESDDRSREDLDAEAAVTLRQDGPVTVAVTDRYGNGGDRFFYVLQCQRTQPSFDATVTGDAFVLTGDKTVEIPITIARKNGFNEPIAITAEGLPQGVTAEPVESAKDGETAKSVKLKLTRSSSDVAFTGAFRVVCRHSTSKEQNATATITGSTQKIADLWLTAVADKPAADENKPAEKVR